MFRVGSILVAVCLAAAGCAVPPREVDRAAFRQRVAMTTDFFERSVAGLREQIAVSGGYAVFPEPVQWGMMVSGGTYGRGVVCRPDGTQVGWACLNTGSLGVQLGIQKFRMLIVFENRDVLRQFQYEELVGAASGVAVAGKGGASGRAPFRNGVALYEGSNEGLMAGVSVGLNWFRYEPVDPRERLLPVRPGVEPGAGTTRIAEANR